jgi:hypothetical protein
MRRLHSLCLAAALCAGTGLSAQPAPEAARTFDFELREDGRLVAAPSVTVQIGRPAAISAGAYALRMRVTRGTAAEGPAPYLIRSSLYRSDGGGTLVASPALTVIPGQPAQIAFATRDGSDLSLAVVVR